MNRSKMKKLYNNKNVTNVKNQRKKNKAMNNFKNQINKKKNN